MLAIPALMIALLAGCFTQALWDFPKAARPRMVRAILLLLVILGVSVGGAWWAYRGGNTWPLFVTMMILIWTVIPRLLPEELEEGETRSEDSQRKSYTK